MPVFLIAFLVSYPLFNNDLDTYKDRIGTLGLQSAPKVIQMMQAPKMPTPNR
jgi:hypothetical protein